MRTFQFQTWGAAIIFTILCMGLIGLAVVLPVVCIQWTWNKFAPGLVLLPPINVWQAMLLYLAATIVLYLTGILQIEIETEATD